MFTDHSGLQPCLHHATGRGRLGGPVFEVNLKTEQNNIDVKRSHESLDIGLLACGGEITRFVIEAQDYRTRSLAAMIGVRFSQTSR